jgi:hypothetical protein
VTIVGIILVTTAVNLLIGSASAKWGAGVVFFTADVSRRLLDTALGSPPAS